MISSDDIVRDIGELLKAVQAVPSSYKDPIIKNLEDLIKDVNTIAAGRDKDQHVYSTAVGLGRMMDEIDCEVKNDPVVSKLLNSIIYRSIVELVD